ncbi:MAG: CPP1-like family protein [Geminocystis sp.]|nr:CPP1-like family protein [Geminocystis sp.]HIK38617.1 CPP1-like family protein [Geminocystis sp. M7585_C2015_104]MCS7147681.1 CPP1-like family protein [Geminocystis sp.]MCX8078476.1 CPP1-like family protein [Geminocystis sp.]MDW8117236.1 CPP1-like family protein [Geminocystis sp.]
MNNLNPYEQLGVREDASFEEIQRARKRLQEQYSNNPQVLESIEIAYDAIIMQRLRLRQEGKIKVPDQIRFPEKMQENRNIPPLVEPINVPSFPVFLRELWEPSSGRNLLISGLIFLVLIYSAFSSATGENLPLFLTGGVAACLVFLFLKTRLFWRAFFVTFISFIASVAGGYLLFHLIANTGLQLGISADAFATLFTLVTMWFVGNFLR